MDFLSRTVERCTAPRGPKLLRVPIAPDLPPGACQFYSTGEKHHLLGGTLSRLPTVTHFGSLVAVVRLRATSSSQFLPAAMASQNIDFVRLLPLADAPSKAFIDKLICQFPTAIGSEPPAAATELVSSSLRLSPQDAALAVQALISLVAKCVFDFLDSAQLVEQLFPVSFSHPQLRTLLAALIAKRVPDLRKEAVDRIVSYQKVQNMETRVEGRNVVLTLHVASTSPSNPAVQIPVSMSPDVVAAFLENCSRIKATIQDIHATDA